MVKLLFDVTSTEGTSLLLLSAFVVVVVFCFVFFWGGAKLH